MQDNASLQAENSWVENVASTGIRTRNLLTWTIWRWVSAILTGFSHFSVCHGPRTVSHYHLGDLAVADNQPELPPDYPDFVHPA